MNQNTSFSRRLRGLFTITDYQPAALAKRLGVVCQAEANRRKSRERMHRKRRNKGYKRYD